MQFPHKPLTDGTIGGKAKFVLLLNKERNINVIGIPMYETLVKMAMKGANVHDISMLLSLSIITDPSGFAEEICKDAVFRNAKDEVMAKGTGKPKNKSDETESDDYTKTVGKPKNKSGETLRPDNTDLIDVIIAKPLCMPPEKKEVRVQERADYFKRRTFEVMRDIHDKDGVYLCYDKTIIAALHTPHGIFLGTNGIKKQPSQHICPRMGQSINQGYDKCVEKCNQPSHAELAALLKYKMLVFEPDFENSWMEVYGAKEVCYHCKKTLELVGIQHITLKPLDQLGELNDYQ